MVTTRYDLNDTGYVDAIEKIVKIRLERKALYGDSWKTDNDEMLWAMIKNKMGRYEALKKSNCDNTYEKTEDTLIDLINYTLFLLQNKIDERRE